MKKIFTLLLLLGSLPIVAQNKYYVRTDGNDNNLGLSWATAFQTLQKALSVSVSGSEIWVAAGTYYPDEGPGQDNNGRVSTFKLKSGVALYGGFSGQEYSLSQRNLVLNETILSGDLLKDDSPNWGNIDDNAWHVVSCGQHTYSTAILDGFTITAGNAGTILHPKGGGMNILGENTDDESTPTIRNCRFTHNRARSEGGALFNEYGSPTLTNCIFSDNNANWGAAIKNYCSSPAMINCTFTRNKADNQGGVMANEEYSYPRITNCILWDNTPNQIYLYGTSITYSIVQGGWGGTGNKNTDPLFTADLRLQGCSPAINAGTSGGGAPLVDIEGQPRPVLGGYDMGAYEVQQGGIGGRIYVDDDAPAGGDGTSWARAFNKLQDALAQAPLCNLPTQVWVAGGTYYPDEGGGQADNNRGASFMLKNNVALYGDFAGNEKVFSQRTLTINPTTLSGDLLKNDGLDFSNNADNAYHVARSTGVNQSAVLDGFIITGGNTATGGNAAGDHLGGGMYNLSSTPTLVNCSFEKNNGNQGGGMYNQAASPILMYCRFSGNKAHAAGAMYNQSTTVVSNCNPTLTGCSFIGNSATGEGGSLYNLYSSGTLVNCSFWGNTAVSGAGMINYYTSNLQLTNCTFAANSAIGSGGTLYNYWDSKSTLTNCILWGNTGGEIAGQAATVSYTLVQDGYPGGSNILTIDPLFKNVATGDLHLQNASPAKDAGDNAAVAGIPYDGDGNTRIYNGRVDLGAYEVHLATSPWEPGPYKPLLLICPGNITLQSDPGSCGAAIDFNAAQLAVVDGGTAPVTVTYTPAAGNPLPLGAHVITVTATDDLGATKTCSFVVTVVDTTAPVISAVTVNTPILYPSNHKLQEVDVNYEVTDNCAVTTTLSVSSNEAVNALGSGTTATDWQVIDAHHVRLRAERSGRGSDRIYTITITAKDAAGNESHATTTVTVPHDKGAPVTTSEAINNQEVNHLAVYAVPNPSSDGFSLTVQSPSDLPMYIKVIDAIGKVIEQKDKVAANGTLYLGSTYRPGVYYVQVQQGSVRQTLKLIKQSR